MKSQVVELPAPSATMSNSSTPSSAIDTPTQNSRPRTKPRSLRGSRRGPRDGLGAHAHSYTCRYLRTNRMEIRFKISDYEQGHAHGEDGLVADAGDEVALAGGGDEGGEGLHRLEDRPTGALAGGDQHDHGLPDGAREAEDDRGHDPRERGWKITRIVFEPGGAQAEGALAQRLGTADIESRRSTPPWTIRKPIRIPAERPLKIRRGPRQRSHEGSPA